jgi:hypothetical protein
MTVLTTSASITPTTGSFSTSPRYSGTFIPTLWSGKLNVKFYAASTFAAISNTNWEGEIANMGDKVVINNIPSLTISDYTIGSGVSYQVPTPSTLELQIDRAKYFAFQTSDVLNLQSKPALMDMFSNDASEQMKVKMDSTCIYRTFNGAAAANKGATAGVKSSSYNLGTDAAPIAITSSNVLTKVLELAAVLDEGVLRREIGGPEVMARQLRRLVEAARLPQVRLQVLPFAAGAHIGITGPFVIFSFPTRSDLDVVVLDHLTSSLYLERKEDLRAYAEAFNALRRHALSPEESLDFIAAVAGAG